MFPVLFEGTFLGFHLRLVSYTLMEWLAFGVMALSLAWVLKAHRLSLVRVLALGLSLMVASLVGARLYFALLYSDRVMGDWSLLFTLRYVNFSLYGGLILALLVFWLWCRVLRIDFFRVSDQLVVPLASALAISKLGCFLNGCCYGLVSDVPWAMYFPRGSGNFLMRSLGQNGLFGLIQGRGGVLRHPTQLYEMSVAILAGAVVVFVVYVMRKMAVGIPAPGFATGLFALLYTLGRWGSFYLRDFPSATAESNFIRGPLTYGLIVGVSVYMIIVKKKADRG